MGPQEIERFFTSLSKELQEPVVVFLTGAAAGAAWGHARASVDIDFAIRPKKSGKQTWEEIDAAVQKAAQETGIAAQYAQEIERWGMITLLDYQKKAVAYQNFGRVEVRLLSPIYWAIGKLNRYIEQDTQDLEAVLRKRKPPLEEALRTWGKALRASPASSDSFAFRRHVEDFLRRYGHKIWGSQFDAAQAIEVFHHHAGVKK